MSKALLSLFLLLGLGITACVRDQPQVIVITATFEPVNGGPTGEPGQAEEQRPPLQLSSIPEQPPANPTANPTRSVNNGSAHEYEVQVGDTLYGIAVANNVSLEALLAVNDLPNPNILSVGQIIQLPGPPDQQTPDFKILPDSRLVRGPGSAAFDVAAFVAQQPGYIRIATDVVTTRLTNGVPLDETLTADQVVQRVSMEFSVDPRLLLALLEYRAGWLSKLELSEEVQQFPMISEQASGAIDRHGLYRQLAWTANELNRGYYGWKYDGWTTLEFDDGVRLLYGPGLNAATVGLQYFLSLTNIYDQWISQVDLNGFYQSYYAYFGDPFAGAIEPLVPAGITQPPMTFPFASGETWFFTGGPHGGWGAGSAWSAVDFAPPDERADYSPACYQSEFWATAVTAGLIVRSGGGTVILDTNGDGDESTGWTVLYLHIASDGRIAVGTVVQAGDPIGHPSCEGGFSNATHMHIARRYNGEWIPAACPLCSASEERPSFVMSDWVVVGFTRQEYQGYMEKGGERRLAEQGRLSPENRVSW
jgi:LasA protease